MKQNLHLLEQVAKILPAGQIRLHQLDTLELRRQAGLPAYECSHPVAPLSQSHHDMHPRNPEAPVTSTLTDRRSRGRSPRSEA